MALRHALACAYELHNVGVVQLRDDVHFLLEQLPVILVLRGRSTPHKTHHNKTQNGVLT